MVVAPVRDSEARTRWLSAWPAFFFLACWLALTAVAWFGADEHSGTHARSSINVGDPAAKALRPHSVAVWRDSRAWRKEARRDRSKGDPTAPADIHVGAPQLTDGADLHIAPARSTFLSRRAWHPRDPPQLDLAA